MWQEVMKSKCGYCGFSGYQGFENRNNRRNRRNCYAIIKEYTY